MGRKFGWGIALQFIIQLHPASARAEERQLWIQSFFDDVTNRSCRLVRLTVARCQPSHRAVNGAVFQQSTKLESVFACGGTDFRRLTLYRASGEEREAAACGTEVRESCRVEYAASDEAQAQRLARMYTETASESVIDLLWMIVNEKSFLACQAKSGLFVQSVPPSEPAQRARESSRGARGCRCQFRCNRSVEPQELTLSFLSSDRCHSQDDAFLARAEAMCTTMGSDGVAGASTCQFDTP